MQTTIEVPVRTAGSEQDGNVLDRWRPQRLELIFLLLCALILAKQLFLPGFIGLADEGDVPKVSMRIQLRSIDQGRDGFDYFQPLYRRGPQFRWDSQIPSSELPLAYAAAGLERRLGNRDLFDIRWMGSFHAILFLICYYLTLMILRPLALWLRVLSALGALWIFADAGMVTYLNSFYMDVAALLGGLAMVMLAIQLLWRPTVTPGLLIAFGAATLLFATAKPSHAIPAVVPILFVALLSWRSGRTRTRVTGLIVAAILAAGSFAILRATPHFYRAQALFDVIFWRIARESKTPSQDLRELGLDDSFLRYTGKHSFLPDSPMVNPAFVDSFAGRTSARDLLRYYVRRPAAVMRFLREDLDRAVWMRRPMYMGNYTRESGMPPKTRSMTFGSWSTLTTRLYKAFPWSVVVWLCVALTASPVLALRSASRWQRAVLWVIAGTSAMAWGEFLICCLADVINTERHLLLFHLFTDATVFLALVFAAGLIRMRPAHPTGM